MSNRTRTALKRAAPPEGVESHPSHFRDHIREFDGDVVRDPKPVTIKSLMEFFTVPQLFKCAAVICSLMAGSFLFGLHVQQWLLEKENFILTLSITKLNHVNEKLEAERDSLAWYVAESVRVESGRIDPLRKAR